MNITKNLTFCITHGRTGTTFVTQLFTLFKDTLSVHEPEPNFAHAFPQVKYDPRLAVQFLEKKLEAIEATPEKNYVETSNVFCKGYFIPMLRAYDHYPNLLLLAREFRAIASSLYKRGSIPVRSKNGQLFSCAPDAPGVLQIFGADQLSDYQMCYWAVLDAFRRQLVAEDIYKEKGLKNYIWCTAETFHEFDFLKKCGDLFGLEFEDEAAAKAAHAEHAGTKYNQNPEREVDPIENISDQEAIVIDRCAYFDLNFADRVLASEYLDEGTSAKFK